MSKFPLSIQLPQDPELCAQLQQKEKEYLTRLESPAKKISAYYKWKILSVLNLQKKINRDDLIQQCATENPHPLNMDRFMNAWGVVHAYTSGIVPIGGTGLPSLDETTFEPLPVSLLDAPTEQIEVEPIDSSEINWDALELPPE